MTDKTIVHLLRHGEVDNPHGILYGRREGFMLTPLGQQMAARVADVLGTRDVVHMRSSPLERAQETAGPLAQALGLEVDLDERVIESTSKFEGLSFRGGPKALLHPKHWWHLRNPFGPSWGEPYREIVARMMDAVHDAREAAHGHEAVIVSHQLPIWTTRLHIEGRSFLHDPRRRQCTLCSLTSVHFTGDRVTAVTYSEPAGDLVPAADRKSPFSAGKPPGTPTS